MFVGLAVYFLIDMCECVYVWPAGKNKQCALLVKGKAPGLWNISEPSSHREWNQAKEEGEKKELHMAHG